MAIYFRPIILTAGRSKSAYFSRRDDSKLTANKTLSQLYTDRESAERAIERYAKRYPMDEIVYSEIEEVDGSRESNPRKSPDQKKCPGSGKPFVGLNAENPDFPVCSYCGRAVRADEHGNARLHYIGVYRGPHWNFDRTATVPLKRRENPIRRVRGGYQWGSHGHVYPTRAGALAQARAAFAHGYREKNPDEWGRIRTGWWNFPYEIQRAKGGGFWLYRHRIGGETEVLGKFPTSKAAKEAVMKRQHNPSRKNDLTAQAMEGYRGEPMKYLYSSPSWYAYKIGEHFRESGRPEPSDVRMGRGYQIHVRDMTFAFGKHDAISRVK